MSNIYDTWIRQHVLDLNDIIPIFDNDRPTIGGFDSETTGLHIIRDKAFLVQFGWLIPNEKYGRVYTFYPTKTNIIIFVKLCGRLQWNVAWNTKFDLHMLTNTDTDFEYTYSNLVEGMAIARMCVEAIPAGEGGDSLALKAIGVNYVHYLAGEGERKVKQAFKAIKDERIKYLTAALKQFPMEIAGLPALNYDTINSLPVGIVKQSMPKVYRAAYMKEYGIEPYELTETGKIKFWGKGAIEDFLKDPTQDVEDLPVDVAEVWVNWQEEYPEPNYSDIDRETMIQYAGDDIITMLEYVRKSLPVIKEREQQKTLEMECKLIQPLYRMERVGIKCDREYLKESRVRMKAYIKKQRKELCEVAGEKITVGQHERIIQVYAEKWNIRLTSADKKVLNDIKEQYEGEPKRFAQLIGELRRLEKWYATYLNRILDSSSYDGRFYTQINQCSAVTGRVGSDAQQFPREELFTELGAKLKKDNQDVPDAEVLFCPRRAFVVTGGEYDETVYIDYSQVELRMQADYTIRVSGGDKNLCRAYMPFKCTHYETKEEYDYSYSGGKARWNEMHMGKSVWIVPETGEHWSPTDVHSLTTNNALMVLGYECLEKYASYEYKQVGTPFFNRVINPKNFKDVRFKGKTFNFMKNYGGGKKAAMDQLNLPETVAEALIKGYSDAFPHVIIFQRKISDRHAKKGYIQNMRGRRYYLQNNRLSYKLANYTVQGTCADVLKEAIILVDAFLVSNRYKTRFQMNIHDELSFEKVQGEEHVVEAIQEIMENIFDSWCLVPIVAEISYTTSNWYEKHDWSDRIAA